MSRRARTHTSILGLTLLFLAVPLWWAGIGTSGSDSGTGSGGSTGGGGSTVPADFKTKLIRSGLGADALAAAGVSSTSVASILQAAADHINASPSALPNADAAYVTARVESDRLRTKIQSGLASQEEISSYATQMTSLATATTQRQSATDGIFNAAIANLTTAQRNALTRIRANHAVDHSRGFPIEFLVVERAEAQWVALRDALANERLAVDYPDMVDAEAQASVATARADATVAAAIVSLAANRDSVASAWNTAAGQ